jgi:small-conductance mechanosensitive channel
MAEPVMNATSLFEIPAKVGVLGTDVAPLTIFLTILVIVAGFLVARFARIITTKYIGTRLPPDTRRTMGKFIYYVIIAIALFSALGISGLDLSGVFLAGGIAGIVIGFATQSLFSNLISGIFLQIDKPMRIGDPVMITGKLPDVSGIVVEITTLSSRLRMFDGTYVRLPNSDVFLSEIRNYSTAAARRVEISIGVAYKEDLNRVIRIIRNCLSTNPLVLIEPEPDVYVEEMRESAILINVWCWVPFSVWFDMKKSLVQQLKTELDINNVEMPYPQRVVHVLSGGQHSAGPKSGQPPDQKVQEKLSLDEFADQQRD